MDDGDHQQQRNELQILPVDYMERLQETAERNTRYRAACVPSVETLKSSSARSMLSRRVHASPPSSLRRLLSYFGCCAPWTFPFTTESH